MKSMSAAAGAAAAKAAKTATKKTAAKKPVAKKAAKKVVPKKVAAKADSFRGAQDPYGAFRDDTAKAFVAELLSDRKVHSVDVIKQEIAKRNCTVAQLRYAFAELESRVGAKLNFTTNPQGAEFVRLVAVKNPQPRPHEFDGK